MTKLQWFLTEQVEEERPAREWVARFRLVGDDPGSLLDLDCELGLRTTVSRRLSCNFSSADSMNVMLNTAASINSHAFFATCRSRRMRCYADRHPRHHGERLAVSAWLAVAPEHRVSSGSRALHALLALGAHRHADEGMGRRFTRATANVDTRRMPHSPIFYGIWRVVLAGTACTTGPRTTRRSSCSTEGHPGRFSQQGIYQPLVAVGPVLTLLTNLWLFGTWGLGMWLIEMA